MDTTESANDDNADEWNNDAREAYLNGYYGIDEY